MAPALTYPVRVDGRMDAPLSRWMWLVKWFLAIPHYFVLAFLWIAFVVLTVVAFFAILFTGRYPRGIFDFNLGVLRWTWRVDYYALGAAATDRYPPFTLAEVPDYPAVLHIDYPGELSRGLVLIKWWLLAIPHYLVIGLFMGGGAYATWEWERWETRPATAGLIGLLVFFALVHLLFTGRYPRGLFDLVLGLNRWVLRVAAYAALMTDQYPPFRLDMGGPDPGTLALSAPPPAAGQPPGGSALPGPQTGGVQPGGPGAPGPAVGGPAVGGPAVGGPAVGGPAVGGPAVGGTAPPGAPPPPRGERSEWSAGRVVAIVFGALLILGGLPALAGGVTAIVFDQTQRDADGLLTTGAREVSTTTYALTGDAMDVETGGWDWVLDRTNAWLGDVAVKVTPEGGKPVFVGLARESDVAGYLSGVEYDIVRDFQFSPFRVDYDRRTGGAPTSPPGEEEFWSESTSGSDQQILRWRLEEGQWNTVVMNADASSSVAVTMSLGAEFPRLGWIAAAMLVIGAILVAGGVVLLYVGLRSRREPGVASP